MGLQNIEFKLPGGVDDGRGWRRDVKTMLLSVDKLLSLGWKPTLKSEEAVRLSCRKFFAFIRKSIVWNAQSRKTFVARSWRG